MKKLLYLMLSLLGFTACGEAGLGSLGSDDSTNQGNGGVDDIPCMYGTPRVEFVVKGKVTDSAGVPIKGILVTAATSTDLKGVTDENGKFVTNKVSWPSMSGKIFFTDTDGAENGGEFEFHSVDLLSLPKVDVQEGNDPWLIGDYEFTADVKLNKK